MIGKGEKVIQPGPNFIELLLPKENCAYQNKITSLCVVSCTFLLSTKMLSENSLLLKQYEIEPWNLRLKQQDYMHKMNIMHTD